MKVKKKFQYDGLEIRVVEREESYMNSEHTTTVTRVMAPNGGVIPISINRKETLKSIAAKAVAFLDGVKSRGADIKQELTKTIVA